MTTRTGGQHTPTSSSDRPVPLRGQVWLANLDKERPVIILTRNPMGRYLNALLAVPVTRTIRGGRNEVPLGSDDGLRYACVANLDQLTLVRLDELEHRRRLAIRMDDGTEFVAGPGDSTSLPSRHDA